MIALNELNIWEKLSSPYGNSEELPLLIAELSKTYTKDLADKIIWEYIYHQGSVYQNTLVTIPHILNIAKNSDKRLKFDLILSLGIVLVGFDKASSLSDFFQDNTLNQNEQNRIIDAFTDALDTFESLVFSLVNYAKDLKNEEKIYFLIAYLVVKKRHKEADIFITFNETEYMFVCSNCGEETFLWNEKNVLNAYDKDPIFNTVFKKITIDLNEDNDNLKWLEKAVERLDITTLQPLIPYFKGNIKCHNCGTQAIVFDGILNSY